MTYPRQPLFAPHAAVATSQPLAAAAGLAVLRRGGNAVDAALATAITLTVVQPPSNDIGGDLFAIVWDGQRLHGLNASGRSPAGLTRDLVLAATGGRGAEPTDALGGAQATGRAMPARGWLPVTVPGVPAGWRDLHDRFGSVPFADLFVDAVGYAEQGHPVSTGTAATWARAVAGHAEPTGTEYAEFGRIFAPRGRAPRAGERWRNPDAARTLRLIAQSRAEDFYRGRIASALADHAARTGGLLTADDLASHTSTWVDPVSVRYRGHEVWELPPNGQGLAALLALGILDGFEPGEPGEPARWTHRQIEAVKLGFADAHAHVADPDRTPVPVAALLAPGYLARRREAITEAAADPVAGEPERGGTVYLCTADDGGMMVSLIQSTYLAFGSHVVLPGYGFALQNRGLGFRLDAGHPNVVGPGKRPYHTIIPGFLTRQGAPVGPFGVMGGHMQPQGHVQLITATVDAGLDPQAALDAPRWYWHAGRALLVEEQLASGPGGAGIVADLRSRGHQLAVAPEPAVFGYGQAIWRRAEGGYVAGSESRVDGGVAGC
ncbi:gamma-glutamyltranspeptidase / glutathione hydrolase [Micromonospora phaseoli]|uniref:Gamma-glutamyltranspeptidase / glutathione hydrolase n=1 Tax=Micromonospora phaseoli TaxID=1144548 RepID=A0A1H7DMU2_9ACTN|nr:gamma-glutamyltransferase family protein [Micromonospora phaseoli]PZV90565.1 gamma-glutamyltranspeptidase/glutathione hydrolase [Micromonospora phaseoli]GIJ78044.1 gamma-glutamyltransferase [Micromonospora phaseoli]SEJ99575.1 gamma-glutamyltranspeptidase / glutathione hydrolase [Micromonospora phaseoli]